jgi:FtsP/CotA-like multicopper oxidase with cupredoxin domain
MSKGRAMRIPAKRLLVAAILVAAAMPSVPTTAGPRVQLAQPVQACPSPTHTKYLVAKEMRNGQIGYAAAGRKPRIPGPTITITEGTCLQVELENQTSRRVSIHTHGVKYTFESDGTPHNKGCVAPGESASYVFNASLPEVNEDGTVSPGTAGYWHYHDHCRTVHGTSGIRKGLYGALIVRRAGDPKPDRKPFVLVMNDLTFNNRKAPRTPIFKANMGERVEFVVIGHGDQFHTFHLHGHSWFDNRTGLGEGIADTTQVIDNKTVGPADSFGFQVVAGQGGVGPGAWMYHCHVQGHSDAGMSGLFVVKTAGGETPGHVKKAIRRWKEQHGGGHHG